MIDEYDLRLKCDALLIALLGKEMAPKWWKSPNRAFDGKTPDIVFSIDPEEVYKYLTLHSGGGW
jgi:hypothetical protein